MPDFSVKYCKIDNNKVKYGPAPLPYFFNDANGDIIETSKCSDSELKKHGWVEVEIRGKKETDNRIEIVDDIEFKIINKKPVEVWTYKLTENCRDWMVAEVDQIIETFRRTIMSGGKITAAIYEYRYLVEEAKQLLASDQQPVTGEYPFVDSAIGTFFDSDGNVVEDLTAVAQLIVDKDEETKARALHIRNDRFETRKAIREAKTDKRALKIFEKFKERYGA